MLPLNRRTFFKRCVSTAAALPFLRSLPLFANPEEILLNRFSIAGLQYYDGKKCIEDLQAGELLNLVPEPENSHDVFAVEIYRKPVGILSPSVKLGYVPRSDNKHLCRLLQAGKRLTCRIIETNPEEYPWKAVKVEVSLIAEGLWSR